jgi:hypothetical protein
MPNEVIEIEELTKKRTPLELLNWVNWKRDQIASTEDGERTLILHQGLVKQFAEEVYPLALFGQRKYGDTDGILMQPVMGSQGYDAVITDLRTKPATESYVEITQAHEGENEYLFRVVLSQQGFAFGHSRAIKKGTRRNRQVSIHPQVVDPNEVATKELRKIVDAVKRKAAKDYPISTSLIVIFEDDWFFRKALDDRHLDSFVRRNILKLDLRFSMLYLIGWKVTFREFSLAKHT